MQSHCIAYGFGENNGSVTHAKKKKRKKEREREREEEKVRGKES